MSKYTEADLDSAVKDVEQGSSQHLASKRWGIPRSTLQGRLQGTKPMSVNKEPMQRLSKKQEGHLREWIITQEDLGVPPTHKELTNFVEQILINQGDHQPLGKNWVKGVLHRNPEIKTTKGVLGASQRSSQTDRPSTTTATTVTAQRRKTRDMKKASARWPAVWKCIENDDRPDAAAWRAILEYNNQVCLDYEAEE